MRTNLVRFNLLACALALTWCGVAHAQPMSWHDKAFWVPDGPVFALAETNEVLYIGGGFTHVGPVTGRFVPISPETGEITGPFEQIIGTISVAIPDGNGGWFVGGIFTAVGSVPRTNIVHILSDRTVDPSWILIPNGRVSSAVLAGRRMFVGGEFTQINGQPQPYLAEVSPQTGELLPLNLALNGSVLSLAVDGSKLFLGGIFTSVMAQNRSRLAAFDLSRNVVMEWRADCDSLVNFGVTLLTVAGGRLYVSGDFITIGSSNRTRLAAIEPDTGRVLPWNVNLSGTLPLSGVAVRSNLVYIAGSFANVGGVYHPLVAALDRETGLLTDWNPQFEFGEVFAMTLTGNTVYVGGDFNYGHTYLAAIDAMSGQFTAWNPSPTAPVTLIAVGSDALYVGGQFDSIGGVVRNQLAAIDLTTGRATSWNPGLDGDGIYSLALAGDVLCAGGSIRSVGGQPRQAVCAVSLSDGHVLPFDAGLRTGSSSPAAVKSLAVWETNLFVGGTFTSAGSVPANGFVAVNTQSGLATGWNPAPLGGVSAFAVSQGNLYLSGTFTQLDGQPRNHLGAFDLRSRQLLDWQPTTDLPVDTLYGSASQVFLTGQFGKVNGQNQLRIASVDAATGGLNAWRPAAANPFLSMTTLGATFYGVGASGLRTAVDVLSGAMRGWAPVFLRDGSPAPIRCTLATSGKLFVGGEFSHVNGLICPWLAAFPVTNAPPVVSLASPHDNDVIRLPAVVELRVEATDSDGSVAEIDYYVNGSFFASSTQPPYSISWSPQIISNYVVTAAAVDDSGERGMSFSAHLTALPPQNDHPPAILVTSPQSGSVLPLGTAVVVSADASDADSRLVRVEFYLRTNLVSVVTNSPYAVVLSNLVGGAYSVTARAVDEYGVTATNGPNAFWLDAFPTVSCSVVPAGSQFPAGTNLVLVAAPQDLDGTIQSVTFFSGTNSLGVKTSAPFTLAVSNLTSGNYVFTAAAADDLGGVGVSPPLSILVYPLPPNDAFAQRIRLSSPIGQGSGSNTFASAEPGERVHVSPLAPRKSLWWTWTPDFAGLAVVSTHGSSFDTLLAAYTGDTLGTLNKLASNDNERSGLVTSRVIFQVTAGTNYQFAVDGRLGATGSVLLTVGPAVALQAALEPPSGWTLLYGGPTNITYILQSSTNSNSWVPIQTNIPGSEQRFMSERPASGFELRRLLLVPQTP